MSQTCSNCQLVSDLPGPPILFRSFGGESDRLEDVTEALEDEPKKPARLTQVQRVLSLGPRGPAGRPAPGRLRRA